MKRIIFLCAVGVLLLVGRPVLASGASNGLSLAASICVNKASQLVQEGKPDQAVKVLQEFRTRQKEKTHYYIDFMLGNCFMMMDKADKTCLDRAAQAYERAVAKQPGLSSAWLNLAQCRYNMGLMKDAAQAFIQGYDTAEKKNAQSLYYGATCWFYVKEYKAALDTFYRLLDAHQDEVKLEWKQILVNTLFALEKNREALPWLKELADKFKGKKQKQWQEVLLYQYVTLGMDKEALSYALYLTRNDPADPRWWKSLAHIHLGKDRLEKGLQSLMIYGFLTPLSPSEINLMADLYLACNIPLEAARYYEDWVKKINEKGKAGGEKISKVSEKIFKIANAYMQGGDKPAALAWADKGLVLEKHPGLLRLKADILFRDKAYEAACDAYEQLAGFTSQEGQARLMAGYAAWNLGQLDRAARAFGLAARHPKQKRAARTALGQIKKIQAAQQNSARAGETG